MTCKEFPLLMSAQVDGYATEREQLKLQRHLRECPACRAYAADLRGLRADLLKLEAPQAASSGPHLTAQIQAALQRETRLNGNPVRRRQDMIDLWMMRLFSQGIGTAVSLVLFIFVISAVFKPAYRALLASVSEPEVITDIDSVDPAIRYRLLILQPPPPPPFSPDPALLELGRNLPEDSQVIATVTVNNLNGRAQLDEVVQQTSNPNAPGDPNLITKLSTALYQKASFQPLRRNEFASRDAVVGLYKINISANLD